MDSKKSIAVILAAGNSTRCTEDKLFTSKYGKPVIFQTLEKFERCPEIDEIVLVLGKEIPPAPFLKGEKIRKILSGGKTRFESLKKALDFLSNEKGNPRILVHNGANPYVKVSEISEGLALAREKKNVIFGHFSHNSLKKVVDGKVVDFLDRDEIFVTQTPQVSDLHTFQKAIQKVHTEPKDEAELLRLIDEEIFIYECHLKNFKITTDEDFSDTFRVGVGEDLHTFTVKSEPLKIGGVEFPDFEKSFEANSDGDPVLHALCNALLSAVGEKPFSSFADEMCESGITDSEKYVERTLKILHQKYPDFQIQNVAISLELLAPKIAPKHNAIVENIARMLDVLPSQIGLMYTSGEGLQEGVSAKVEVLIRLA